MRHLLKLTLLAAGLFPLQPAACPDVDSEHLLLKAQRITVAAPFYPTFSEPQGQGVFFDIIREVYGPSGYQIETCILPIRRSIRDLQAGLIDLYLSDWDKSYLTDETLYQPDKLHTPQVPISIEFVSAVMISDDQTNNGEVTGDRFPEALFHNTQQLLAWPKGFDYQLLFRLSESSYQTVDNLEQGLSMLKAGRIKAYLHDMDDIRFTLQHSDELDESEFTIILLRKQPLYPVFQNTDQGLKLAQMYDFRMRELLQQKRILKLYQNWGYDYQPQVP